jgi:hypothetical protein
MSYWGSSGVWRWADAIRNQTSFWGSSGMWIWPITDVIPCVKGGAGETTPDELLGLVWCVDMKGGDEKTRRAFLARLGM